jgi:outer membrane lipoprotein carrier protein
MKMRKVMLSVCMLCCATAPALAQTDAKAQAILQNVSKKINSLKSLKANFALHLTGGKVNETKKGTFAMKGQKYHVLINGQEIICDTKTMWTYTKDDNSVQVSAYDPNAQTISPAKLFTNFYDKEYRYKYMGEQKVQGKSCDVIEMTPIAKGKQFAKIDLDIDKTTSMVVSGNVYEKSGSKYQYDISGFAPNASLPDTYFTFDAKAHPGVEVVDLR